METGRLSLGQVLVCVGCCCGRTEEGNPPVPVERLKAEWKRRRLNRAVQLTVSGCLGPCDLTNVACVAGGFGTLWLGGLSQDAEYDALIDWAEGSAAAGRLLPLPGMLAGRRFERYRPDGGEP